MNIVKLMTVMVLLIGLNGCTAFVALGCKIKTGDKFCESKKEQAKEQSKID